jgi:hypothetical protein
MGGAQELALQDKITIATFYSPHRDSVASESWVAYKISGGYSLGVAYVWGTKRVRPVSSVRIVDEMAWHPGLTVSTGFRSWATGLVTDTALVEKSFGNWHLKGGVGLSSGYSRAIAGGSYNFRNGFIAGLQADGKNVVTFLTFSKGAPVIAGYLVNWKHPAYLLGWRF